MNFASSNAQDAETPWDVLLIKLAGALVYAKGIFGVGRSVRAKVVAARLAGWMATDRPVNSAGGRVDPKGRGQIGPALTVMAGLNAASTCIACA